MKKTRLSKKAMICACIGGLTGAVIPVIVMLLNNRFKFMGEGEAVIKGLGYIPFTLILGTGLGALIGTLIFPDNKK
jgi:predicted membrane-bound spermidine synthase